MRLVALLLLLMAAPVLAEVRAVFVGIDSYEYSRARVGGAGFDDLSGAVGDAVRIKAALGQAYGWQLDVVPQGACSGANAVSQTLLDGCATKARILAAWNRAIDASAPGDTLILYFAGHGSRFLDDLTMDQASRYNSTLMAADARKPGAQTGADILDHEVRGIIDRATGLGVRVVTLFDSCNSGTASRDGRSASRTAPDLRVRGLQPLEAPAQYGNYGAYRVHIGAAGDGQDAKEVGSVGARAGVFTTALAAAIVATPQASFADLAATVVTEVTGKTGGRQLPHAEGALRATLGGPEIKVRTFAVVRDGARLMMAGGALVGVTEGSRFALYARTTDALNAGEDAALAMAYVTKVADGTATLTPDSRAQAELPARMVALEVFHGFGGVVMRLAVDDPQALSVVRQLGFVGIDEGAPFALVAAAGGMELRRRGGILLAALPPSGTRDFDVRLVSALEKVARVEAWMMTVQAPLQGAARADISLCVRNVDLSDSDPAWCPPPPAGERRLKLEQPAMISVINGAASPRFVYVLAIDEKYEVAVILPAFGAVDPALAPGQALRNAQEIAPVDKGALRFVALSSDAPLDATVLEQTATDVVDLDACLSAVARAFCLGSDTQRTGGLAGVGAWSSAMVMTEVVP
jgi:hypothetical protein